MQPLGMRRSASLDVIVLIFLLDEEPEELSHCYIGSEVLRLRLSCFFSLIVVATYQLWHGENMGFHQLESVVRI